MLPRPLVLLCFSHQGRSVRFGRRVFELDSRVAHLLRNVILLLLRRRGRRGRWSLTIRHRVSDVSEVEGDINLLFKRLVRFIGDLGLLMVVVMMMTVVTVTVMVVVVVMMIMCLVVRQLTFTTVAVFLVEMGVTIAPTARGASVHVFVRLVAVLVRVFTRMRRCRVVVMTVSIRISNYHSLTALCVDNRLTLHHTGIHAARRPRGRSLCPSRCRRRASVPGVP